MNYEKRIREIIERGGYAGRSSNPTATLERFAGEVIEMVSADQVTVTIDHSQPMRVIQVLRDLHIDGDDVTVVQHNKVQEDAVQQEPVSVFDNNAAWNLAQKVRTDLDRKSCPGVFMDLAMESINRRYTPPAPVQRGSVTFQSFKQKADVVLGWVVGIDGYDDAIRELYEYATNTAPAFSVNERLLGCLKAMVAVCDDECRSDHNGYCQEHFLDNIKTEGCRVAEAKKAIEAAEAAKKGGV